MKIIFNAALLTCGLIIFGAYAFGQSIDFSFEVDGKPVKQNFKVIFYFEGNEYESRIAKGRLSVPLELAGAANITGVRFSSKKYDISFSPLFHKDLDAKWTLGIDTKPFNVDNTYTSEPYENVQRIQYLRVRPRKGDYSWVLVDNVPAIFENPQ